ncbi:ABC transporter permease [Oleiharenicola lentus]|uniref:ABC transporter permease n=1 Tax=Oleiharenicola lentus TaxID=2508720 RepID=A0A4Q1C9K6_9BACT|nr:ABC transporter permease [Oleiharenicola lentus]RXK55570.1 ABC transporter permease [Oleiharenicola lentus]
MHSLLSLADLRQILRRLARERGFTLTVLLTLALCIGANVAIYAVVDAVLVRALPYPEPGRLVTTVNAYPGAGVERAGASLPNYYDRREQIKAFASTSVWQGGNAIIGGAGSPQRVDRDRVSPEFFATLGVPLAMGRTFTEEEMFYKDSSRAILTDEFWRQQFNADPEVLGKTFIVDSLPVTVVGVLPPGFRYFTSKARFFVPLASDPKDRLPDRRHSNNMQLIARLAPGASLAVAQEQVNALNAQQVEDDPFSSLLKGAKFRTDVFGLHADTVRDIKPVLLLLQGGVFFLLLIGGVNLVNLLLIRASGRTKELAVRQALGAGAGHVAGEVAMETVLLALGGGLLGLAVGAAGIQLLAVLGTDYLPVGSAIVFDARLALISLGASALVGLLLSLPIIWFSLHARLASVLQTESRGGTTSRAAQRVRHGFIVAQVALAFVLLSGAGLLGLSLRKVMSTSPGFRPEQVLTGNIALPWKGYPENEQRLAFMERLLTELRAQPGVVAVGLTAGLPMGGNINNSATTIEGQDPAPGESVRAHYMAPSAGEYWQAMGIPLIEGRFLEDADNHRDLRVCLVDQDFARRYWPGSSPLGRRLSANPKFDEKEAFTIVGVVGNVKQRELAETNAQGAIYFPMKGNYTPNGFSVVLRTAMEPTALAPMLQKVVLKLDPELPVDELKPMQAWIDESMVARRSPALLAIIFAAVALVLAAVGTYGVLAYAVNQRRREIGVRMALGAQPGQVLAQFLGLGARLLAAGVVLGALGAWGAGKAMQKLLFGVGAVHPGVLVATAAVMMMVVLLATFLPSRRASRVSPIEALRDD